MSKIVVTTETDIQQLIESSLTKLFDEFAAKFCPSVTARTETPKEDESFTVQQLAEYWQCHPQTIFNRKRSGELPFYQSGRKIFFKKSEIDKLTRKGGTIR